MNINRKSPFEVAQNFLKEKFPNFEVAFVAGSFNRGEEGADTILWLLLTNEPILSGSFYFDQKKVSAYIAKKYNPSEEQRLELLKK